MKLKKGFGFIVMAVAMFGLSSTLSSVSHAETKVGFVYVDLLVITAGHTNMIELDWQLKKRWETKLKQRL